LPEPLGVRGRRELRCRLRPLRRHVRRAGRSRRRLLGHGVRHRARVLPHHDPARVREGARHRVPERRRLRRRRAAPLRRDDVRSAAASRRRVLERATLRASSLLRDGRERNVELHERRRRRCGVRAGQLPIRSVLRGRDRGREWHRGVARHLHRASGDGLTLRCAAPVRRRPDVLGRAMRCSRRCGRNLHGARTVVHAERAVRRRARLQSIALCADPSPRRGMRRHHRRLFRVPALRGRDVHRPDSRWRRVRQFRRTVRVRDVHQRIVRAADV